MKRPCIDQYINFIMFLTLLILGGCTDGPNLTIPDCRSTEIDCPTGLTCEEVLQGRFDCVSHSNPINDIPLVPSGGVQGIENQEGGNLGGESQGGRSIGGSSAGGSSVGGSPMGGSLIGGSLVGGSLVGGSPIGGSLVGGSPMGGGVVGGGLVGGSPMGGEPNLLRCGDGIVNQIIEECDDEGASERCNENCTFSRCGDGIINQSADEECDDEGESERCNENCSLNRCGDGIINQSANEECDDEGESESCNENCSLNRCGDGIINQSAGEECDEGEETVRCNLNCTLAQCGDGILNSSAGEVCDGGGESPTCNTNCRLAICGDRIINTRAGEECDEGGETANCDEDCTLVECGDQTINLRAGERCETYQNGCSSTCTPLIPNECSNRLLDDGDLCTDTPTCCGPGMACVENFDALTRVCRHTCLIDEGSPFACPSRQFCVPLDPEINTPGSPGQCLFGDECIPGSEERCGPGEYSCLRIENLSFCIGDLTDLRILSPFQVVGLDQLCDPFDEVNPVYCGAGLVCEVGACRAVCETDLQCGFGQRCLDYTDKVDGVPFKFCLDVCDPFNSNCNSNESCALLDVVNEEIIGQCTPLLNGNGRDGSPCSINETTYWGSCSSDLVCTTETEADLTGVCRSLCSATSLDQCQEAHSGCAPLVIEDLGICRGECHPLSGEGCSEEGEICISTYFVNTPDHPLASMTGSCLPQPNNPDPTADSCELLTTPNFNQEGSPYYSTCGAGYYCSQLINEDTGNIEDSQCLQICQDLQRIGLFEVLDTDNNQLISSDEWELGFIVLDQNQNGFLLPSEWSNPNRPLLDLNEDQLISLSEWSAGYPLITQQQGDMNALQYDQTRCVIGTCQTDVFNIETFWGICL